MYNCIFKDEIENEYGSNYYCAYTGELLEKQCSGCIFETDELQARGIVKRVYEEALKKKKIKKIIFGK